VSDSDRSTYLRQEQAAAAENLRVVLLEVEQFDLEEILKEQEGRLGFGSQRATVQQLVGFAKELGGSDLARSHSTS
jgi:hypothetical protein